MIIIKNNKTREDNFLNLKKKMITSLKIIKKMLIGIFFILYIPSSHNSMNKTKMLTSSIILVPIFFLHTHVCTQEFS